MSAIREEIGSLKAETTELRKFGWVVGLAFLLLAAFLWWRGISWFQVPAWIGGTLVVLGTLVPKILRPVYFAWMSMAVVMGFVMTRVLLTIFFFLVIVPVGLFFRLIGRDALQRKIDPEATTYWIDKEYAIKDRSRFEKFF